MIGTIYSQTAVIYARFSSHAQREVSIDQQIKACRQFAERNGIEIVNIYEDRAMTGTNDQRPGFQKMIADSAKSGWNYIIVYSLDRFARNRYDSAVYKRQLKNNGVKVLSAMENISDDPSGILMESMLEGLAEYYSSELSRKVNRGMEDNAAKCLVNGPLPLGYERGPDGKYAIKESEAVIVREIFHRVKAGEALIRIVDDLNLRQLRTKKGSHWNRSSFNTILSNERYTGVYIFRDTRVPGGIPAIIPRALFDDVQEIVHTKKNARRDPTGATPQKRRRQASTYLLTGKLFCGHCRNAMTGISGTNSAGQPHYYYTCKGRRAEHDSCDKKNVRREDIEYIIASSLKAVMFTDEAMDILSATALEYQKRFVSDAEFEGLKIRHEDVTRSIRNIVKAIEQGVFTPTTQSRLKELEEEQHSLSQRITIAEQEREAMLTREDILTALRLFKSGDIDSKRYQESLIDTFLVAAYVYDHEIRIVFNLGSCTNDTTVIFDIEKINRAIDCLDAPIGDHREKVPERFCSGTFLYNIQKHLR